MAACSSRAKLDKLFMLWLVSFFELLDPVIICFVMCPNDLTKATI